jgi:ABC-type multidrug transport system ATPase subunit
MSLKDVMVYIKDVTKKYGDTFVLKGFSLEIVKGEIMCLLGANGSGKSTLVNILSGLTSMDDGDILMNIDER